MTRRVAGLTLLAGSALLWASCGRETGPAGTDRKVGVFVSILPQAQFVERVGGEHVDVDVLVGPGQEPHTFEPTPRQMTRLGRARLYFRVGLPFEETLCPKLASIHKGLEIVDTRDGIELRPMTPGHAGENENETGAAHGQGETDPHVWLSPKLARIQARTICEALCRVDAAHQAFFRGSLHALQADLDRLDSELAQVLSPLKGRSFYVFHPAFGYLADAYGLKQKAVETGGKDPGPRHIAALIEQAKADGVKVIFVQPQFPRRAAETIADQIGGVVVPMDPLARDYLGNLRQMAEKIRKALSPGPHPATGAAPGRQDRS